MENMTIFIIISTTLGITRAMPQLVRIIQKRNVRGVSVDTSATSAIVSLGWAVYGFWTHQLSICFASGATAIIFIFITLAALHFGRQLKELKIAPVWVAVLILFGAMGGPFGFGLVLPISVLAANIPQVWVAYKEVNLTDLSLGTWILAMIEGFLWAGYGIIQHDVSVLANNFFLVTTSGMIVTLKLMHMNHCAKQKKVL